MRSPSAVSDCERSFDITAPEARASHLRLKRWFDATVSAVALALLSPLLALIGVLIRLDSPGPAIFRQTRIGKGGRAFEMWKLRTMDCDASDQRHRDLVVPLVRAAVTAKEGTSLASPAAPLLPDPRVTRVGKWLRRTSLDELPQLVNVLHGDMSLVGPRPPVAYEYEEFDDWLKERLQMPPGMTGLWQVAGYHYLNFHKMYDLDLKYVRSWSLWLDVKILAKTLPAVMLRLQRSL